MARVAWTAAKVAMVAGEAELEVGAASSERRTRRSSTSLDLHQKCLEKAHGWKEPHGTSHSNGGTSLTGGNQSEQEGSVAHTL